MQEPTLAEGMTAPLGRPPSNYRTMASGVFTATKVGATMTSGARTANAGRATMTSPRSCQPRPPRPGKKHPVVVVSRVITQVNNKIIFILSLRSGRIARFRTVGAVKDHHYIQNNSTVFVWIVCCTHPTRRAGTSLWGVTLSRGSRCSPTILTPFPFVTLWPLANGIE